MKTRLAMGIGALALMIPSVPQRDLATRIDTYLRPFVETNNFSGVIYIERGEQVLFQRGYGLANPTFEIPNMPATRFHIASISKGFTAAAILLLEERGQLSTNDSVAKFLPDFPQGEKIRLAHLLTHSAGVRNVSNFTPKSPGTYAPYTAADLVAEIAKNPLDFEPGARFRYTNSDYNVLARIIEVVSKQPFGEFMQANVFDPLGLRSSMHDGDARLVIGNLASGTGPSGLRGVSFVPYLDWSTKTGSGSLVSSAADLCRFARAVFAGGWLRPTSLAKIAYARPAPAAGQLAVLAGRFQFPAEYYQPNAIVTIRDRGDYLELAWPSGDASVIYPTGGDDFVDRTNWAMVHVTRDDRGEATGFTYSLLQDFTVRKLQP